MKEEVIKEVIELVESKNKIIAEFRAYFGIALDYCSISKVKKGNSSNKIVIITDDPLNPNKKYTFNIDGHSIVRETGKTLFLYDSSIVIKWIEDEIKKLESINKKLEEL